MPGSKPEANTRRPRLSPDVTSPAWMISRSGRCWWRHAPRTPIRLRGDRRLIVDREPSWTIAGLVLNRRLEAPAIEQAARATLFLHDWRAPPTGGPVGSDPVILAELLPTSRLTQTI